MLLDLNKLASAQKKLEVDVNIDGRLPTQVALPFTVHCQLEVNPNPDYSMLVLDMSARLNLICQRCCDSFEHVFTQHLKIAVCETEEKAQTHMEYECIVAPKGMVNLNDILIDTCHLYLPEFHINPSECNPEVQNYLKNSNDN